MAFKMRSGNGPLAFKNMGSSSPAKGGIMDIMGIGGDTKQADKLAKDFAKQTPKVENITSDESKTEKVKPKKIDIVVEGVEGSKTEKGKRHKVGETNTSSRPSFAGTGGVTKGPVPEERKAKFTGDSTKETTKKPKKHQAQIRKQKRLDKITARREAKGKEGLSSRQIRLQGEVDKTAEQFVSDRKEKRAAFGDALVEVGNVIGGKGSYTTNREKKTQDIYNQINQMKLDNAKKVENKETTLPTTDPVATKKDGTTEMKKKKISIAAQVHLDNLEKQGATVQNADGTYSPSSPAGYKRKKS